MFSSYTSSTTPRADTLALTKADRAEIQTRIQHAAAQEGCDALIMLDPGNIAYGSGLILPYAEQYPLPRAAVLLNFTETYPPTAILPTDWLQLPEQQSLGCRTVLSKLAGQDPSRALLRAVEDEVISIGLANASIGVDMGFCAEGTLEFLSSALPSVKWVDFTRPLNEMRAVKTPAEVNLLEEAARQADRALVSAINHSEGCVLDSLSYSLWEFAERIRVHIGEFGGSAAGHITVLQGKDMQAYSLSPRGNFINGNMVRAEATSSHRGYWADMARTIYVGDFGPEEQQAYEDNLFLKEAALEAILPGIPCNQIFQTIQQLATERDIDLWQEPGIGHGIGTSEREAPYLCSGDPTVLSQGMVIVLAVYTRGLQHQLICSKDTYVVTESGTRLLSWYRNWDRLYCLKGNTARHG